MSPAPEPTANEAVEAPEDRFEMRCGVMLAIFASILAIMELGGDYADYGMEYAQKEKASAYAWFNSKGIKQNLAEGQRDTLRSLIAAGVIGEEHAVATQDFIDRLDREITAYQLEKDEIMAGSSVVGEKKWAQELDGKLGQIVGAKQWEVEADAYEQVTQIFDLSNLFLQICLVVGAISLIVNTEASKLAFFRGAVGLGSLGTVIGVYAFIQYLMV